MPCPAKGLRLVQANKHIALPFFPRLTGVQEWLCNLDLTDGPQKSSWWWGGGESVYIGHNLREVFAFLIRGAHVINTAIMRARGSPQEDESQYAKDDEASSQEDPGSPKAWPGGELRTPICLGCNVCMAC